MADKLYQLNTDNWPRPETPPTPLSGLDSLGLALRCETVILLVEKAIIQWAPGTTKLSVKKYAISTNKGLLQDQCLSYEF